jgi:hypothetical protein
MDWPLIVKSLGALGITSAAFAAAFAWLLRSGGKWFFDARLAIQKREFDQELEIHKSRLSEASAVALERLRADLEIATHQSRARISALVERQANVVSEIYGLLIDAEEACEGLMIPVRRSDTPSAGELAPGALKANKAFIDYFDRNLIFLGDAESEPLHQLRDFFRSAWGDFEMFGIDNRNDALRDDRFKRQEKAWETVHSKVPIARERLTAAFRNLLGVSTSRRNATTDAVSVTD